MSESAIYSICRKYKERKHLNGNYPGRKPKITEEQKAAIIRTVEEQPDITLTHLFSDIRFITRIKQEYINNEISSRLQLELDEVDRLWGA